MHQRARLPAAHPLGHLAAAQHGRKGQVATGQRLADAEDVGDEVAAARAGPEGTGAVEPRRDLVVDDERTVLGRETVEHSERVRAPYVHPPGALEHGFDDDRRHVIGVGSEERTRLSLPRHHGLVVGGAVQATRGAAREEVLRQQAPEHRVHPTDRVGDRHRGERVSVVATADGEEPGATPPRRHVPLEGHLHRDLDGHRPGVGEEHVLEGDRGEGEEPSGEPDGRLVRQPAEHDVRHRAELPVRGRVELRHGIPVDGTPPRRHPVHHLTRRTAPVAKPKPDAACRLHEVRVLGGDCRRVRVPQVRSVEREQLGGGVLCTGRGHRSPLCRHPRRPRSARGVRRRRGPSRPRG